MDFLFSRSSSFIFLPEGKLANSRRHEGILPEKSLAFCFGNFGREKHISVSGEASHFWKFPM